MIRRIKKLIFIYIVAGIAFTVIGLFGRCNFELNTTESMPKGLYYVLSNTELARNDMVTFCPPYNEFLKFAERQGFWGDLKKICNRQTPKYMKKIVGIPGDSISVFYSGVYVNNVKIANSEAYTKILSDKIFAGYEKKFVLKSDEYFLMSDYNPLSFDSRYFGVIKREQIISSVNPFFVIHQKGDKI